MFSRNIWSFKPADPGQPDRSSHKARSVKLDAGPLLKLLSAETARTPLPMVVLGRHSRVYQWRELQ